MHNGNFFHRSQLRFAASGAALLAVILFSAAQARADVVCVPNDAIDGSCTPAMGAATIAAGILLAAPGDTVLVDDGTYSEFVNVDRDISLLSRNGRAVTIIDPPANPTSTLGTVRVTNGTTAAQIGAPGQGFTINGIDNVSAGIESAALYFQGSHSNAQVLDNEIVAAGDHGLLTEFGATISGFVISDNEFSGSTFVGSPAGYGFGAQFTLLNVPRQLVVMGDGSGGGNTSNVTFTGNVVSGAAGGVNPDLTGTQCPVVAQPCEQGNNLVTIDSDGATITGNTFAGTTSRFATSLRARGPGTAISGNDFDSTGLTPICGHVFLQNIGDTAATVAGANTFDKGVYLDGVVSTIGISIAAAVAAVPSGSTIDVLAGTYDEPPLTGPDGTALPMQILVDKVVSIVGADETLTIVRPTGNTAASGDARGWFFVNAAGTLNLSDLALDGTGRLVWQAVRNAGNGGSVTGVRFTEIKYNEGGPHYAGTAVAAFGTGAVNVSDSTFDEIGRVGVLYFGAGVSGSTFMGNTYTGKGTGDFLDYMLDISAGAGVSVSGNSVSGNRGVASSDSSQSAGVLVSTFFGAGTSATVDANTFADNTSGIVVGYSTAACPGPDPECDTSTATVTCNLFAGNDNGVVAFVEDGSTVSAQENSFVGNVEGVDATAVFGGSVDAIDNWWGSVDGPGGTGPGSGDPVTVNVTFSPFATAAPACVSCIQDADCDDGLACNGSETCNTGTSMCEAGVLVDCSTESDACHLGLCTEPLAACIADPLADGTACAGDCSAAGMCASGTCEFDDTDGDGVCDADERPGLSLRVVNVFEGIHDDRDSWTALGELGTTTSVDFNTAVTTSGIEVVLFQESAPTLTEVSSFFFAGGQCAELRGSIRCRDATTKSRLVLRKRSATDFFRVRIRISRQNLTRPMLAEVPLTVGLRTAESGNTIDRGDDIGPAGCLERGRRIKCRELP